MPKGKLIAIDGMDGAGKGTLFEFLKELYNTSNEVMFSREPGGTGKGEEIRDILLSKEHESTPLADFLLFWAALDIHMGKRITPARGLGTHVILDRFDSSTWAYQICGEEHPELLSLFIQIRQLVIGHLVPDAYIFLDLPPEVAFDRRKADHEQERDRFDLKPIEYYERVRDGFKNFPPQGVRRSKVYIVDAQQTPEEVFAEVRSLIQNIFDDKSLSR